MSVISDIKMILENADAMCITDAKTYTEQKARIRDAKNYVCEMECVRADAIREFAERIKSSQDAYSWCCADGSMEYCNGDHCESCMDDFKEKIDKIAEQMIADMKKG